MESALAPVLGENQKLRSRLAEYKNRIDELQHLLLKKTKEAESKSGSIFGSML